MFEKFKNQIIFCIEIYKNFLIKIFNRVENILNVRLDNINNNINSIKNDNLYWKKNDGEYHFIKMFYEKMNETDFKNKYMNLISNLDRDSINTVNKYLARIQKISLNDSKTYKIFSNEEAFKIDEIKENLTNSIVKINNDCYTYDNYYLPIKCFDINVFYYKHNLSLLVDLEKIKTKNIIDAGGYIGDSSIVFSEYTDKQVHTFEPTNYFYEKLLDTINLNNFKNIIPHKLALDSKNEELEMQVTSLNGGSSFDYKGLRDVKPEKVNVVTLDTFVEKNPMEIGLIKVDIEGAEQQFLEGAKKTIIEQKPTLLISLYHKYEDFFLIKPMIESWNSGYKFRIIKTIDGNIYFEPILICEQ